MTPALEFLLKTRKEKVNLEVEDDFAKMQETSATTAGVLDPMRSSAGFGRSKKSSLAATALLD